MVGAEFQRVYGDDSDNNKLAMVAMTPETLAKDLSKGRFPDQTALRACRCLSEVNIAEIAAAIGAGVACLVGSGFVWL